MGGVGGEDERKQELEDVESGAGWETIDEGRRRLFFPESAVPLTGPFFLCSPPRSSLPNGQASKSAQPKVTTRNAPLLCSPPSPASLDLPYRSDPRLSCFFLARPSAPFFYEQAAPLSKPAKMGKAGAR